MVVGLPMHAERVVRLERFSVALAAHEEVVTKQPIDVVVLRDTG